MDLESLFRAEHGRAVAVLIRVLGDIDLAEDAVQDAFAVAAERWPVDGVPPSPIGWIITTARNRAIDRLRRESRREAKHQEAAMVAAPGETLADLADLADPADPADPAELDGIDDRLRLIFTCCHPALGRPAQVALTLRLLGGLGTPEIARAFLVPEPTMGQRISRAKAKIRDARIPYRVPARAELPERLGGVLAVVYLIFNAGYSDPADDRGELCAEAIRLGRLLGELMPGEPEVTGLVALMLLQHARRAARTDAHGELVLLGDQDRSRWDHELIAEGHALVRACLVGNRPGPYQVQAAIAAVHTDAEPTDWRQVLLLYDHLMALAPSPVVALNRAVAVAELDGPQVALRLVDGLSLKDYPVFHAVRADLLRRLDRPAEAAGAYRRAAELSPSAAERHFLEARALNLG